MLRPPIVCARPVSIAGGRGRGPRPPVRRPSRARGGPLRPWRGCLWEWREYARRPRVGAGGRHVLEENLPLVAPGSWALGSCRFSGASGPALAVPARSGKSWLNGRAVERAGAAGRRSRDEDALPRNPGAAPRPRGLRPPRAPCALARRCAGRRQLRHRHGGGLGGPDVRGRAQRGYPRRVPAARARRRIPRPRPRIRLRIRSRAGSALQDCGIRAEPSDAERAVTAWLGGTRQEAAEHPVQAPCRTAELPNCRTGCRSA